MQVNFSKRNTTALLFIFLSTLYTVFHFIYMLTEMLRSSKNPTTSTQATAASKRVHDADKGIDNVESGLKTNLTHFSIEACSEVPRRYAEETHRKTLDVVPGVPVTGAEANLSKEQNQNGKVPEYMLARWLKEGFQDGPFHNIGTVGPSFRESRLESKSIASSLQYYNP